LTRRVSRAVSLVGASVFSGGPIDSLLFEARLNLRFRRCWNRGWPRAFRWLGVTFSLVEVAQLEHVEQLQNADFWLENRDVAQLDELDQSFLLN